MKRAPPLFPGDNFMHVLSFGAFGRSVRLAALTTVLAAPLAAQAAGTIRGRVVEIGTQRPIPEVQVTVTGTSSGGLTNLQGDFVITAVPTGQREVSARRIGFTRRTQTVVVPASGEVRADFT